MALAGRLLKGCIFFRQLFDTFRNVGHRSLLKSVPRIEANLEQVDWESQHRLAHDHLVADGEDGSINQDVAEPGGGKRVAAVVEPGPKGAADDDSEGKKPGQQP